MRLLTTVAVIVWALAAGALAAPSARDRAAIKAYETSLPTPLPDASGSKVVTLEAWMAAWNIPGVSVAFIEDGRIKWVRTHGVADVAERRPVTPNTLFQAASMSKMVAAAAALRLVEQGRLDLDEDVNSRLKAWKVSPSAFTAESKVTLRRLLSHTAGLTVSGFPGYLADKPVPTVFEILDGRPPANTPAVRSFEPPGAGFAYSGGGYTLAQLLMIEAAGGEPYPALLDRLILRPAGMTRATFVQPLPARLTRTSSAGHDGKGLLIPGARNTFPEYAAASLWTTPSDYGRFMIALQNSYAGLRPALLSEPTARTMMTRVAGDYGLGVVTGRRGERPTFEHGGGNRGFQCYAFGFLDGSRQGAVIMTNSDVGGVLAAVILRSLGESYGWGEAAPPTESFRRAPYFPAQ